MKFAVLVALLLFSASAFADEDAPLIKTLRKKCAEELKPMCGEYGGIVLIRCLAGYQNLSGKCKESVDLLLKDGDLPEEKEVEPAPPAPAAPADPVLKPEQDKDGKPQWVEIT